MIYLDSAATTLQKPPSVGRAMQEALRTCASPGRGGHRPAMRAADVVYACRRELAELFGLDDPGRVVLTSNATHALNLALYSLLAGGGHAVISGFEHNSVVRPLEALRARGVTYTVARSAPFDAEGCYRAFCEAIRLDTACVVCNHVSNVFGCVQPLREIHDLCLRRGIPLVVDASQSAGVLPLDMKALPAAAFVCMPGHKALFGPQGTGVLLCGRPDLPVRPLLCGGTGSLSRQLTQPTLLPDGLESGTHNVPGAAGLLAGVRFVRRRGLAHIRAREAALCARLARGLAAVPGVRVFAGPEQAGVLSFTADWCGADELCARLGERGFCLRGGLHCAPLAHECAGTLETGTARASLSPFNTPAEVDALVRAVRALACSAAGRGAEK